MHEIFHFKRNCFSLIRNDFIFKLYLCIKFDKMIVVTGAAGFIGSCLVSRLNKAGKENIVVVDDFSKHEKDSNLMGKKIHQFVERSVFETWLNENKTAIEIIFHIGARTDTTEFNKAIFDELNVNYTKMIWRFCSDNSIPMVYASSAATYGLGEHGYEDDHSLIPALKPLNPYGDSKNDFDIWALQQKTQPPFWAGLKFFNVYGPNEYHKGRMASVIFHAFNQIVEKGSMNLFRSHNPNYTDGGQLRDFVYVKDVVEICLFLMEEQPKSGIYNLGSGKARTFLDLATNTFHALGKEPQIGFIDTPIDIRDKYQYFTEANMQKMLDAGYQKGFHTLEEGVKDYVQNYLMEQKFY
jgi:ADP-L-glycero-D-manno-heptose 6-epimerase